MKGLADKMAETKNYQVPGETGKVQDLTSPRKLGRVSVPGMITLMLSGP